MKIENLSFKDILKNIILKTGKLKDSYKNHPNTKYSLDLIIDELIYVLKTGVAWRNLRSPINHNTLYWHFQRLVKYKIFDKLFNHLRTHYYKNNKNGIQIVDSSFIQNKYGKNKKARNKFFKNKNCNKISLLTDGNGVPLSVFVNKGIVHDISFMGNHVKDCYFIYRNNERNLLLADKGYESRELRSSLNEVNCGLMIPKKKNMITTYYFDKTIYKNRTRVENTFQKLKAFRKVMIRYESLFRNYKAFVLFASSILIFRSI